MRNLLQSLVLAAAIFVVAGLLTSSWVAGIAPALLAGGVLYFVLARRSFKAFEAIVTEAMGLLAGAQANPAKIDVVLAVCAPQHRIMVRNRSSLKFSNGSRTYGVSSVEYGPAVEDTRSER
jgi:hypothetical protein